jgi:hypothetical protein
MINCRYSPRTAAGAFMGTRDPMPRAVFEQLPAAALGLDRIVALYYPTSTLYHIH